MHTMLKCTGRMRSVTASRFIKAEKLRNKMTRKLHQKEVQIFIGIFTEQYYCGIMYAAVNGGISNGIIKVQRAGNHLQG